MQGLGIWSFFFFLILIPRAVMSLATVAIKVAEMGAEGNQAPTKSILETRRFSVPLA